MDIIDKIFSRLQKDQAPGRLKAQVLAMSEKPSASKHFNLSTVAFLKLALPVAILAVVSFGLYYQYFRTANLAAAFELQAEARDEFGVLPNSTFILKASRKLSDFQVRKAVQFDPEVDYDLDSLGDNKYRLTPKGELSSYQLLKVTIEQGVADRDYSWAYQVKAPFQVISTVPGNHSTIIPVSTGVEITFNREKFINPKDFFTISPNVNGDFEQRGEVLIFKPKRPLEIGKVYTVNIKGGMTIEGSTDTLSKDYQFEFETEGDYTGENNRLYLPSEFTQFHEAKPTVVSWSDPGNTTSITVYRCAGADEFLRSYMDSRRWDYGWSSFNRSPKTVDSKTCGGTKAFDFKPAWSKDESQYRWVAELPQALARGYYFFDYANTSGRHDYQWMQITELAHYTTFTPKDGILWLYDHKKNQSVADASLSLADNGEVKTSDKGLAQFNTPKSLILSTVSYGPSRNYDKPTIIKVNKNGYDPYFVQATDVYGYDQLQPESKYWSTMSLDRPLYKLSDKINYWGTLRGRDTDKSAEGTDVTLKLYSGGYFFFFGTLFYSDQKPLIETKVKVSEDGVFSGSIDYQGLSTGQYSLIAFVGDEIVATESFTATTYAKGSFTIDVKPQRQAYFADEAVKFDVTASFYDGTPVGNLPVRFSGYYGYGGQEISGQVTTDSTGHATASLNLPKTPEPPPFSSSTLAYGQAYGQGLYVGFTPLGPQEGTVASNSSVTIFNARAQMLTNSETQPDNSTRYKVELYKVDLNRPEPANDRPPYQGDPLTNHPVDVWVEKVTNVATQIGEHYDYVSKVVVPEYSYSQVRETIETNTVNTDGQGKFEVSKKYPAQQNVWYNIMFRTRDQSGTVLQELRYLDPNQVYYSPLPNPAPAPTEAPKTTDWMPVLSIEQSKDPDGFSVGDKVSLALRFENQSVALPDKSLPVLYYGYQRSILTTQVISDSKAGDTFKKEYRPGIYYRAVVFGPNGFEETYDQVANFKVKDATLKVTVDPDKEQYRPGDEVKFKIKVRNAQDKGQSASLNIAVIDQAIYDLLAYESPVDAVGELYRYVAVRPLVTYTRYLGKSNDGGGGGGGGDEVMRADFKDTALWRNVNVGSSGETEVSFKLPDNLTQWSITTQAYNDEALFAGTETKTITTSLPLFVDAALSEVYLAGDQPQVLVRVAGKDFKSGQTVTVEAKSEALKLSFKKDIKDNQIAVPLPKLSEGQFDIDLSVSQGQNKDTIRRKITVVPSYFVTAQSQTYQLSDGLANIAHSNNGLTRLVFADSGKGKYVWQLYGLSYSYGARLDQRLVAYAAQKDLHDHFGIGDEPEVFDAGTFIKPTQNQQPGQPYGELFGLGLITYGDAELEASSLAAQLQPNVLPKDKLAAYFRDALNNEQSDLHRTALALVGLAGLGQPVLARVQALAIDDRLSDDDRLLLLLAQARMGDQEGARTIYADKVRPKLTESGDGLFWPDGDQTKQVKRTTRVLALAESINQKADLDGLWKYVQNHYPEKDLDVFERMIALRAELNRKPSAKGSFHFSTNRSEKNVELDFGQSYYLELLPDEAASIKFDQVKGEVSLTATFDAYQDPATIEQNPSAKISKSYRANGRDTATLGASDLVQVALTVTPDKNFKNVFQVTDFLPSGLKPFSETYSFNPYYYYVYNPGDPCRPSSWFPSQIEGNRVTFTVYRPDSCGSSPAEIIYYARVTSLGSFKADPAYVQGLYGDDQRKTLSKPNSITIK